MKKLWILGAEGLLGTSLLEQCAVQGISVIGTGRMQADITDKDTLVKKGKEISPTHIINCAAYTDVDKAEIEYDKAFSINARGAQNAAETAQEISARFIHISTDFVFDDRCERPYREETEASPINTYGRSKWEGEKRVIACHPQACIIRTSWLFGKGGKNFFSSLIGWMQKKEQISAVSDQWGCATYAPDLASAILDLLDQSGIFHFAHADATSRFEIAQFVQNLMSPRGIACKEVSPVSKEAFPMAAPRPSFSVLNTGKYTRVTGKQPRSWREAIQEFIVDAVQ